MFSSEKDKFARQTYKANFGDEPSGDISATKSNDISDFNVLLAGFPCQPFSQAGFQKCFADERNLFPELERIIGDKRPDAFILENVKALLSKKFTNEFTHIINSLQNLGYTVFYRVYNAKAVVPQNRERVFIVGFKDFNNKGSGFEWPELPPLYPVLRDVLEFGNVPEKYFLKDKTWQALQRNKNNPKHNFGFNIGDIKGQSATLLAKYGNDGRQILIPEISKWTPYHRVAGLDEQANAITAQYGSNGGVATLIPELKKIGILGKGRQREKIYDINGIATSQLAEGGCTTRFYNVPELKQVGKVGKGGQGQRILVPKLKRIGQASNSQCKQIYDIDGIAPCQLSGGDGHSVNTGLYLVPEIITVDGVKY